MRLCRHLCSWLEGQQAGFADRLPSRREAPKRAKKQRHFQRLQLPELHSWLRGWLRSWMRGRMRSWLYSWLSKGGEMAA
jgi:hypothetical protein